MIIRDQPTCFPSELLVAVSSRDDGTMLDRTLGDRHHENVVKNRIRFCEKVGVNYAQLAYQIITYEPEYTYNMIVEVTEPNQTGIRADVLFTETPGVGLFLPIADCIGTVLYDPTRRALALAHLGRHSSMSDALASTIKHFIDRGSSPHDLIVWMAPSVAQAHYQMEYFDKTDTDEWRDFVEQKDDRYHVDMARRNRMVCLQHGVPTENIYLPTVDTAVDSHYFSHSQGDTTGRFAVIAMIRK